MNPCQQVVAWNWKTFLRFLPSVENTLEDPFICYVGDVNGPLAYRFRTKLAIQHDQQSVQKINAVSEAIGAITVLFDFPIPCEARFEELKRRWRLYEDALNMKSDREISGSMWTIAKLAHYIKPEDIAFVQPESRFDLTGEALQKICERVDLAMKAICGRDGTVEKLCELKHEFISLETNTRMILDAILQPLCVYKGLTLRSEKTLKSEHLPANRYDYIMYYTDYDDCNTHSPIGVVEAKRQGCLRDDSVAQLLVQLLLLSSEEPKSNSFHFGVLSDAYQFIFTGVTKQKVFFFQTNENQLEITTVKSDEDVRSIVGKMSWLIDLAIQSRRKSNPIETFLARVGAWKIQESFFQND